MIAIIGLGILSFITILILFIVLCCKRKKNNFSYEYFKNKENGTY